nr:unnamed protein product [Callosobruchus analis]
MPKSWEENQMAGKDWLISFRRKHDMTLRKPEPCSLVRATVFNRHNVEKFCNNLENFINWKPTFTDGTRIFNLDEISNTTVDKPQKVITLKGKNGIASITSAEKGTLVTTCCIVSANGNNLPVVLVYSQE